MDLLFDDVELHPALLGDAKDDGAGLGRRLLAQCAWICRCVLAVGSRAAPAGPRQTREEQRWRICSAASRRRRVSSAGSAEAASAAPALARGNPWRRGTLAPAPASQGRLGPGMQRPRRTMAWSDMWGLEPHWYGDQIKLNSRRPLQSYSHVTLRASWRPAARKYCQVRWVQAGIPAHGVGQKDPWMSQEAPQSALTGVSAAGGRAGERAPSLHRGPG